MLSWPGLTVRLTSAILVICPQPTCQKEVSFKEKFKMLQLIWWFHSKDIQEKILASGAALDEGKKMS